MGKVRVWWHRNEGVNNFGDLLGPYLVKKITGKEVVFAEPSRWPWPKTHMIIGSILAAVKRNCVVWGPGIIKKDEIVGRAKFLAVRGPLTRKRLVEQGYDVPEIYGDPALLLPKYYQPKSGDTKYELGIIPHHVDYQLARTKVKDQDIKVIDLTQDIEQVIDDIYSCKRTVSSSLHGIIVSHAYGIPSVWVKLSEKLYGDNVKFYDYFQSVGISDYTPVNIFGDMPTLDELKEIVDGSSTAKMKVDLSQMMDMLMTACPFKS